MIVFSIGIFPDSFNEWFIKKKIEIYLEKIFTKSNSLLNYFIIENKSGKYEIYNSYYTSVILFIENINQKKTLRMFILGLYNAEKIHQTISENRNHEVDFPLDSQLLNYCTGYLTWVFEINQTFFVINDIMKRQYDFGIDNISNYFIQTNKHEIDQNNIKYITNYLKYFPVNSKIELINLYFRNTFANTFNTDISSITNPYHSIIALKNLIAKSNNVNTIQQSEIEEIIPGYGKFNIITKLTEGLLNNEIFQKIFMKYFIYELILEPSNKQELKSLVNYFYKPLTQKFHTIFEKAVFSHNTISHNNNNDPFSILMNYNNEQMEDQQILMILKLSNVNNLNSIPLNIKYIYEVQKFLRTGVKYYFTLILVLLSGTFKEWKSIFYFFFRIENVENDFEILSKYLQCFKEYETRNLFDIFNNKGIIAFKKSLKTIDIIPILENNILSIKEIYTTSNQINNIFNNIKSIEYFHKPLNENSKNFDEYENFFELLNIKDRIIKCETQFEAFELIILSLIDYLKNFCVKYFH